MASAEPARRRPRPSEGGGRKARRADGVAAVMRSAVEQLSQLLGRPPESVSSVRPTEDGWEAQVEVLELERIPETTSILASYKVTLDERGDLISYERTRRYSRGAIDRPT
ncbi:gas vesicle protein [Streptomyces sp. G2]|uniref:gas vesicle protein GvpO n=1 Tax=Streptomyces TaxID=1883 RepID=UPI00202FF903|nr:gas vesicle protein [Streptomyces sp. G2]MCM1948393.1 gas vesicle protein [Streptomyces sp. G2]